jgi:hypothetical protein
LIPIQRELRNEFIKRKMVFQSIKTSILKDYNITSNEYSIFKIDGYLKTFDIAELQKIQESSK